MKRWIPVVLLGVMFVATAGACDPLEFEPQATVSVEYTCTMPAIAPNGAWNARVEVYDGEFSGVHGACGCDAVDLPFVVTGGTEDRFPPTLDSAVTSPDPVLVGSRFILTIRSSDEHPATYTEPLHPQPNLLNPVFRSRTQSSETQLSPTQYEWTFDCPPYSAPGDYVGQVYLYDQDAPRQTSSLHRARRRPRRSAVAPAASNGCGTLLPTALLVRLFVTNAR